MCGRGEDRGRHGLVPDRGVAEQLAGLCRAEVRTDQRDCLIQPFAHRRTPGGGARAGEHVLAPQRGPDRRGLGHRGIHGERMGVGEPRASFRLSAKLVGTVGEHDRDRRDSHRRAVSERSLPAEEAPGRDVDRDALPPERQELQGARSVAARGIAALEEGPRKPFLVHGAVLEEGLGEHEHHFGVVGVRAPATARLDHLQARWDRRSGQPFVGHPEGVAYEGAQQGSGDSFVSLWRALRQRSCSQASLMLSAPSMRRWSSAVPLASRSRSRSTSGA